MLLRRILGACLIIAPVLFLCVIDGKANGGHPGIWMLPLAFLTVVAGCTELVHLLREASVPVRLLPVLLAAVLVVLCSASTVWVPDSITLPANSGGWEGWKWGGWSLIGLAMSGAMAVLFAAEILHFGLGPLPIGAPQSGQAVARISYGFFCVSYIGLPVAILFQIRMLSNPGGILALISVFFVVKISDAAAFFAGRSWGKSAMAPHLSPKKTWEGFAGGVLGGVVASAFYFHVIFPNFMPNLVVPSTWTLLGYGVTLALAGVFGDLSESLIKRDTDHKDSGRWLLGLGGGLDVFDSISFAAPIAYLWWSSGLFRM